MCYYFIIHLPNFLFALIKQIIRSSHSELCKKTSCSAMLQDGPIDHDSRKVPVKKFSFNKYVNFLTCYLYWNLTSILFKNCNEFGYINSQCLLLNILTNATRDTVQFVIRNTNTRKWRDKNQKKERKFEEKVREKGCVVLIFISFYLHFYYN